jgi:hypothetical protein
MKDLAERVTRAVDVLKAAVSNDQYAMVGAEIKHKRTSKVRGIEGMRKGLCELALDILTGEHLPSPPPELMEMLALRHKFHTEHMLDKAETDRFDELLNRLADLFAAPVVSK